MNEKDVIDEAQDNALEKIRSARSFFGFFYLGFKVSMALRRPLNEKNDFPIENLGTTDPTIKKTNFKVCCQGFREKITAVIY